MDIILLFLQSFYLLIPAFAANIIPALVKKINFLNIPVDFGKKMHGKRIFGRNKTYRGLFFGTIAALIATIFQSQVYSIVIITNISLLDYSLPNIYLFGTMIGLSSLLFDLLRSFFKRQLDIPEGKEWMPLDHIDYGIGVIVVLLPFTILGITQVISIILVSGLLHYFCNRVWYKYIDKKIEN
jgi:hypothetical protein